MKVYVLEIGEFSDRRIVGVFSSRELAEAAGGRIKAERWSIDGLELDELAEAQWGPMWYAHVEIATGKLISFSSNDRLRLPERVEWIYKGPEGIALHSPISEEHARKVAVEARQKWLREHPI